MSERSIALGMAFVLALSTCGLFSCRSVDRSGSAAAPVRIDVGSGSRDAVARRSARELADSPILARLAPRAGDRDRRYAVRIDNPEAASPSSPSSFESMLEYALVATGSFLIVEGSAAPAVHSRVSATSGGQETRVWVSGPDGELWVDVRGILLHPN